MLCAISLTTSYSMAFWVSPISLAADMFLSISGTTCLKTETKSPLTQDRCATKIMDFAKIGILPTRLTSSLSKPASYRRVLSVFIDQNFMCPWSQSAVK